MKSFILAAIVLSAAFIMVPRTVRADGPAPMPWNTPDAPTNYNPAPSDVATDPAHLLQPQDIVRVQIFGEDDLSQQCNGLSVSDKATLTLPLIGTISVKGQSIQQAQEQITELYNKNYLVNPQVTVSILKYASRSVNVIGSVTNQGRVKFPPGRGLTILDAIALAGGQTRLADLKHVKLTRKNAKGETLVRDIDVDAMMKQTGSDPVPLQPGDIIYIPERML